MKALAEAERKKRLECLLLTVEEMLSVDRTNGYRLQRIGAVFGELEHEVKAIRDCDMIIKRCEEAGQ